LKAVLLTVLVLTAQAAMRTAGTSQQFSAWVTARNTTPPDMSSVCPPSAAISASSARILPVPSKPASQR
jgi:hypothetical protein